MADYRERFFEFKVSDEILIRGYVSGDIYPNNLVSNFSVDMRMYFGKSKEIPIARVGIADTLLSHVYAHARKTLLEEIKLKRIK